MRIPAPSVSPRPGVDAGWSVLFAGLRARPRAIQANRSSDEINKLIIIIGWRLQILRLTTGTKLGG
jgi:hypothetical protein